MSSWFHYNLMNQKLLGRTIIAFFAILLFGTTAIAFITPEAFAPTKPCHAISSALA